MTPDSTIIRAGTMRDVPAITALVNKAFGAGDFFEGERTQEPDIISLMQKGIFFTMESSSGNIVAVIYVEQRGERAYFGMLSVDPSLQKKGLGQTMIEKAETYARKQGCEFMDIIVLSVNAHLPPYYKKRGYSEVGTEAFVPKRPLKAGYECFKILMTKPL